MSSGSRILSKEEVKQVLDHFKSTNVRNYAAALMSVSIGTRIAELLSLRWKDLDGKYVNIKSLKGSNNASFPMSDELLKALKQLKQHYYNIGVQIDDITYLFLSREGVNKPLSSQHWNFIIRDACKNLKYLARCPTIPSGSALLLVFTKLQVKISFEPEYFQGTSQYPV